MEDNLEDRKLLKLLQCHLLALDTIMAAHQREEIALTEDQIAWAARVGESHYQWWIGNVRPL